MDNKGNFRRIVLIIILVLLVALSLMISRMAGTGARNSGSENAVGSGETQESPLEEGSGITGAEDKASSGVEERLDEASDSAREEASAREDNEDINPEVEEARRRRENDERYVEYRRQLARESLKSKEEEEEGTAEECEKEAAFEEEEPQEEPYVPPTIMIISDLHYISPATYDLGSAFWEMVFTDDGKLSPFSDLILDAVIDEAIERNVSALVMAGDNTLNGELINHEELARKLGRLKDAGIPVLLVPGNHDINNTDAAYYIGDEVLEAEYLHTADEYYEIYQEFYEGANSRDPDSLSYVYPLDETHWIMLLDSAWYEDKMHADGRIRPETLVWMEEVFKAAESVDALVVPVAHHNLLSESRFYTKQCVMINYDEVQELLEKYELPLFLSGHLHAQRIKKHKAQPGVSDDDYGFTEIVSSPISIAPCQYGILSWDEDDAMHYEALPLTAHMDVDGNYIYPDEEDASEILTSDAEELEDEILESDISDYERYVQTFEPFAQGFTESVIEAQVEYNFPNLPVEVRERLAASYAYIYYLYCSGSIIDWDDFVRSEDYALWEKYSQRVDYISDMRSMAKDNTQDYHTWYSPPPEREDPSDENEESIPDEDIPDMEE